MKNIILVDGDPVRMGKIVDVGPSAIILLNGTRMRYDERGR